MNHEIKRALVTIGGLYLQTEDRTERTLCHWASEDGRYPDPIVHLDDADVQLRLAGYTRNHEWTYCPIKLDGLWVSVRRIDPKFEVEFTNHDGDTCLVVQPGRDAGHAVDQVHEGYGHLSRGGRYLVRQVATPDGGQVLYRRSRALGGHSPRHGQFGADKWGRRPGGAR